MQVYIKETSNGYKLTINDRIIENLSDDDLRKIVDTIDKIWYAKDVDNYLEENDIQLKPETRDSVIDTYAYYRNKNDGDDEGMTWSDCLDCAMEDYPYGDVFTDKMKNAIIDYYINNDNEALDLFADYYEDTEDESFAPEKLSNYKKLSIDEKTKLISEYISSYVEDDDDGIELYEYIAD